MASESPDNVGPTFEEGLINYGTGVFILEAHKTMDLTPAEIKGVTSELFFADEETDVAGVNLTGAEIYELDDLFMAFISHRRTNHWSP